MTDRTIFDALALAQRAIKNPPLDGKNPHFKSRYATLGRCLEAVRGPLAEQGVAVECRVTEERAEDELAEREAY